MGDKYYKAIQWLRKHPDQIIRSWRNANLNGKTTPGSILFKGLMVDIAGTIHGHASRSSFHPGFCPIGVKNGLYAPAPLDEIIRNDPMIAKSEYDITIASLPAYAKCQRLADELLFRDFASRDGKKRKPKYVRILSV